MLCQHECRDSTSLANNGFTAVSRLTMVVLWAGTSNPQGAKVPSNVSIRKGNGSVPKDSVVTMTQFVTVDKSNIVEKIGSLSPEWMSQGIAGIELLLRPAEPRVPLTFAPVSVSVLVLTLGLTHRGIPRQGVRPLLPAVFLSAPLWAQHAKGSRVSFRQNGAPPRWRYEALLHRWV